ncbi:hypothetical protein [uncultured Tyzzerella sp.]|uniref:hypothetical protein n=1 Tax=uncultured Tyzzerella sp. TaxID=2321398 RepID=UPI002942A16F|nr:hypothetical protein [uncultured Tyzzerella sp.]
MEDNKFTNKSNIEYPLEEDFVDIKVLNNNTRLLDTKKANISDLEDVARESTPMAIENAIKNISNDVSQNLQNVAKESEPNIIESKIIELENRLNSFIEKDKIKNWYTLPNLKKEFKRVQRDEVLLEVNGKGHLIMAVFYDLAHKTYAPKDNSQSYKVEIDDRVIFDIKIDFSTLPYSTNVYSQIGIVNTNVTPTFDNRTNNSFSIPFYPILSGFTDEIEDRAYLEPNSQSLISLDGKNRRLNTDSGQLNQSGHNWHIFVPAQANVDYPIKFLNKLKISTYETTYSTGFVNSFILYNLDN